MLEASIVWAKEYGDVLGSIGFLFALSTVLITNGRVIYDRIKNPQSAKESHFQRLAQSGNSTKTPLVGPFGQRRSPDYGDKVAIAILPPSLLGQIEPDFAAGLVDDIVADLQQAGFISPDTSVVAAVHSELKEPLIVAEKLGVNYMLKSSIRSQDSKYRISVQLVDISGAIIWSKRFTEEGDDYMAIQENISHLVADGAKQFINPDVKEEQSDLINKPGEETKEKVITNSSKSRLVAMLLCLPPMGLLGFHRFYVGRPFTGVLYLLTLGLVIFGWIIDLILILFGLLADGKGKPVRFWRPDPPQ